jgi:two-component system response regulator FixJ
MNTQTVFIVDDDPSVRDATRIFLELNGLRARTFSSGEELLAQLDPGWSGCILLDLKMPGMNGLEVQQALNARAVALPIVIVTAHGEVRIVRDALKAGALDFLEKPVEHEVLLDVVRHALDFDLSARASAAARDALRERLERLTLRERQVMQLLAQGQQHRDIAQTLGISPRTVEVYKSRMMEKLGARGLADVIRMATNSAP